MKGRLLKKAAALSLAALLVTGGIPAQPIADMVGEMVISASADTNPYDMTSAGYVYINSTNAASWQNKTITGSVNAVCSDTTHFNIVTEDSLRSALVVDGTSVTITISDLSVIAYTDSQNLTTVAPIMLRNNAVLTLILEGENTLTGCFGGAGIHVPEGCELIVQGTGSLNSTGGDTGPYTERAYDNGNIIEGGYIGGAGIGASAKTKASAEPTVGTIRIEGGTVTAKGGGHPYSFGGAAGIGGSGNSDCGTIEIFGGTINAVGGSIAAGIGTGSGSLDTPHNFGSIRIGGNAVVNAYSGAGSAAIGGGAYNTVGSITIDGGNVTATARKDNSCAIGSGYGDSDLGFAVPIPQIIIANACNVTASGSIGHPEIGDYTYANNSVIMIGHQSTISCSGEVFYDNVQQHTINVTAYDPSITTAQNGQTAYLQLGDITPVSGKITVTTAGKATFTAKLILDYGLTGENAVHSCSAKVTIGSGSQLPEESVTLQKAEANCDIYIGYRLHIKGTVFDDSISPGQQCSLTVGGTNIPASFTCTDRKAVADGYLYMQGSSVLTDNTDYSAAATFIIGELSITENVTFKKTVTHEKSASFIVGEDSIDYIDENGDPGTISDFTRLTGTETELESGWYAIYPGETVTFSTRINVQGNVRLILGDGATLNASKGIDVGFRNALYIYSQSDNNGTLNATGSDSSAGIGGANGEESGNIFIYGGVIEARGDNGGAGIGGGLNGDASETAIKGRAKVKAYGSAEGSNGAAGIGGGAANNSNESSEGGNITIGGSADVIAEGANLAAGIGGGSSYNSTLPGTSGLVYIEDTCTVTAKGGAKGAGIGSGYFASSIYIMITGGTVSAVGGENGAGIGGGYNSNTISASGTIIINGGSVTCRGGANAPGIGAGIGWSNLPSIEINGGIVNAVGGSYASGIGWGRVTYGSINDQIVIYGGQITATPGSGSSYGISAYRGTIHLQWRDDTSDYITCNGKYNAWGINENGIALYSDYPFKVVGSNVRASGNNEDDANFNYATIVPMHLVTLKAGESIDPDSRIVLEDDSYTVPQCRFTAPDGKKFLCWQKNSDPTDTYEPGDMIDNITTSFTLTALWQDAWDVTVDSAAASCMSVSPSKAFEGETVTVNFTFSSNRDYTEGTLKTTPELTLTKVNDRTYTFVMPAQAVSVTGEFPYNAAPYVDAKGVSQTPITNYTKVSPSSSTVYWNDGWYVVWEDTVISGNIYATGNINLILADGATLTAEKGILLYSNKSLTIWGQENGTGTLNATGNTHYAAIGSTTNLNQTITVNGGCINAVGGSMAPGLSWGNGGGTININGGIVNATGGEYSAGVGGEWRGSSIGTINITGGTVNAKAASSAAAIGTGGNTTAYTMPDYSINISGGIVNAYTSEMSAGAIGNGRFINGSCTINLTYDDAVSVTANSYKGTVKLNKPFRAVDSDSTYAVSENQNVSDIAGKTLIPADSFAVQIENGITGGTVTADKFVAKPNTQVTLTVTPDSENNYRLKADSLKVTYGTSEAEVTNGSDPTKYTFIMPAADVTVTAAFTNGYIVSIDKTITHGTVSASPSNFGFDDFDSTDKTVTLNVTPDAGYILDTLTVTDSNGDHVAVSNNTFTMPADDVNVTAVFKIDPAHFSIDGDTYTIYTATGWELFCDLIADGETFSGKTVKLGDDISVSRMACDSSHRFKGTFNGQKNTLTVNYSAETDNCAPFLYIENAAIENLNVTGNITTSKKFGASIAAHTYGTTNITNCHSTVTITGTFTSESDGTHGGFVAVNEGGGTLTFTHCSFSGRMLGENATSSGGFAGWNSGTKINYTDCIFAPAEITMSNTNSSTFNRNVKDSNYSFDRAYYLSPFGTAQGTQVFTSVPAGFLSETIVAADGNTYYRITGISISTTDEWNTFANAVNNGTTYEGLTVVLENDISVSTMVGTSTNKFKGTFDGNGHILTVDLSAATDNCAPFLYVDGATVEGLTVTGTISASHKYAAGIAAQTDGTTTIKNCRSNVTITSSVGGDGTHGGFVGAQSGTLNIEGCVFNGKLITTNGTNKCGGFVGWKNGTVNVSNSLYAPADIEEGETEIGSEDSYTLSRRSANEISNSYYTRAFGSTDNQGKFAHTITAGKYVTVTNGEPTETYSVSGITAYTTGLAYDGKFYAAKDETVTLGNTVPSDCIFNGYTVSAGTINGNTLTMPDEDVTVTAEYAQVFTGENISLGGDISVIFYLDSTVVPENSTVTFTKVTNNESVVCPEITLTNSDKTTVTVGGTDYEYYAASCYVNAAEMTSLVTATVAVNGKEFTRTTSVKAYANKILNNDDYSDAHDIVTKMLDYGAKAQTKFNKNTDNLANAGLKNADETEYVTDSSISSASITSTHSDMENGLDEYGLAYEGTSLLYLSRTTLRHYYTITDTNKTAESVIAEIEAANSGWTGGTKGSYIYFEMPNIGADDLATAHTLTINGKTYSFSALDYSKGVLEIYEAHKGFTDNDAKLARATYLYAEAAKTYINGGAQ